MSQMISHGDPENREIPNQNLRAFVSPWLARAALWLLPLSFLIVAFFFPLSRILALTFDFNTLTTQNILLSFRVLLFTFYQATLSTLLTLLLGLPSAYLFARFDFRGKSLLRALTAVPVSYTHLTLPTIYSV